MQQIAAIAKNKAKSKSQNAKRKSQKPKNDTSTKEVRA